MTSSLVGSEMCIRDRSKPEHVGPLDRHEKLKFIGVMISRQPTRTKDMDCLLYTSDAADDM
eukprot:9259350-Prorocentrum_lima.AAC.1